MKDNYLPVVILTLVFFLNFLSRTIISPLMLEIEKDLAIDHQLAGYAFLTLAIGYFFALFNSDKLSARIGHLNTILASIIGNLISLVFAGISGEYSLLLVSLFLLGLSTGLYLPSGISAITSLIQKANWGKALAIHELAPNLAFITAPLIVNYTSHYLTWNDTLLIMSVIGFTVLFALIVRKNQFSRVKNTITCEIKRIQLARCKAVWMWVYVFGLGITGTLGVYLMLPLYMVSSLNLSEEYTNTLLGISRIVSLPMAWLAGLLTDKLGEKKVLIGVLTLSGITTLLIGIVKPSLVGLVLFTQAGLSVCFFPPAFSAISHVVESHCRSAIISFIIPFGFLLGGGLVPLFLGFMGKNHLFEWGFTIVGFLILSGALICRYLFSIKLKFD